MGEATTNAAGNFHVSGATREATDIEVVIKVYHDCLDQERVIIYILKRLDFEFAFVKMPFHRKITITIYFFIFYVLILNYLFILT
jgi:hypothetical protein